MKVLVTGSNGLVGSALLNSLKSSGHQVIKMARAKPQNADEIEWNPDSNSWDASELEGADAVVHLAGENIAAKRWSNEQKHKIIESREKGTANLCRALASLKSPPKVLVCASAIGFYGDRDDEKLYETSQSGKGFLAEVCRRWEGATHSARAAGIRVVHLRFGVVLSPKGGALVKMLTPFRLGLGGKISCGAQYMSWITLDDAVGIIRFALENSSVENAINAVSPNPVTNAEFTRALGRALGRPTIFPMPRVVARIAFGEMADELLLASSRVFPRRLIEAGFKFQHPMIEPALRAMLN